METPNIKLHYFDIFGRGELIRFILNYNKVKFEDKRYTPAEWLEVKKTGKFPFGQLPVLEIDDKIYAQSMSIARYLCQRHGQYPFDSYEAYLVEAIKDYVEDIHQKFATFYGEKDQEKRKAIHETFLKEALPAMLPGLTKILKENKHGCEYMVGNRLTLADFVVVEFAHRFLLHKDKIAYTQGTLEANPELYEYLKNITEKHFKEYFENRKVSFF